jgi:hypothetical protein
MSGPSQNDRTGLVLGWGYIASIGLTSESLREYTSKDDPTQVMGMMMYLVPPHSLHTIC